MICKDLNYKHSYYFETHLQKKINNASQKLTETNVE